MLIVVATNAPSFFPEWWQAAVYGFGLGAGLFGSAYAYHFTLIRDDLKRKDENIAELEKRIATIQGNTKSSTSNVKNELPDKPEDNISNLKTQAFALSGKMQAILLKVKNQPTPITDKLNSYVKYEMGQTKFIDTADFMKLNDSAKEERAVFKRNAICEYLETCHSEARLLREKIWDTLPSEKRIGKKIINPNPKTVEEVQSIAHELERLASQLED